MAKTVYSWDTNNVFTSSKIVDDDYTLQSNETFIKPVASDGTGLYEPIKWTGASWQGATKAEWGAAHPAPKAQPSVQQQFNANMTTQFAQVMATQAKINANLTLQLAQVKKQLTTKEA